MNELVGELPLGIKIILLMMVAFFVGRWSARRKQRQSSPASPPAASTELRHGVHSQGYAGPSGGAGIEGTVGGAAVRRDPALEAELRKLLRDGRKIDAIKVARERLALGLKEAKDLVESL
ncbi:MAG: ribosomal protein L7/L12 [Hyphomicrobiaceae bacterium]